MQAITTDRNSLSGGSDSRGNSFNAESIDAGSAAVLIQALKQASSSPSPPPAMNYNNNYNSNSGSGNRGRSESGNSNPPANISRENSATNIKKTVSQESMDEDEVDTTRVSDTNPEMVLQANPLLSSRSPSTSNSPPKPVTEKKEVAKQSFEASNPILAAMNNNKKSENEVLYEENPVLSEQRKEKSVSFAEEGAAPQSNKPTEKNDEEDKEGGEEGKPTSSPNQGGAAAGGTSRRVGRSRLGHRYRPAPPSSTSTTTTTATTPPSAPSTNEEA
jgi:hypothetical protein